MKPIPSNRFDRELIVLLKSHRLSPDRIKKILYLIKTNPHHPSLRLHKLSGTNNFAASVDRNIRIILHFDNDIVVLMRIGSHDEVY